MATKFLFSSSLGSHSKQAGGKDNLPHDVPFCDTAHLPFPHHIHGLVALQGSPRALEGKEAHPWFDEPLDKAMVLLDQVVEVFDLSEFDLLGKDPSRFEVSNGFGIGRILQHNPPDHGAWWLLGMLRPQNLLLDVQGTLVEWPDLGIASPLFEIQLMLKSLTKSSDVRSHLRAA